MANKKNNSSANMWSSAMEIFHNKDISKNLLILSCLLLLSSLVVMLFMFFVLKILLSNSYKIQTNDLRRFSYWMERVGDYPNSPDVLYNAAVSAVNVRKYETALILVRKARTLDPKFKEAISLEEEIIEREGK